VAGGLNLFGEPNFRCVWGWNRLDFIGGTWEDRDEHGVLLREVTEFRREPKYFPANRWHIERWMPPETYGTPKMWYGGTLGAELGPYPSRGDYEHCFTLETPEGGFLQLTPAIARHVARALEDDHPLRRGEALVSAEVTDKDCAADLAAAEAEARRARKGTWADPTAIKNAESTGDILAGVGRFTVVEGKILSVRQAGATTYLNFGRNWTRDFAVTISRRMIPAFEAAGLTPKSLENRRIRVRGYIEARGGPRIEALLVGQIEMLGGN